MKRIAFTLSEVLLTLTIIGVVSAMTVPSLISSIEDKELASQAKKAYNTLQSAISMKYTLTRQTPADVLNKDLFTGLLATSNAPVLKYNALSSDGLVIQLPDGIIMALYKDGDYCTGVDKAHYCHVKVDVNGEDGPTFSAIEDTTGVSGVSLNKFTYHSLPEYETYDRKHRDLVFFIIQNMSVKPNTWHAVTKRYFTGQQWD